MLDDLVGGAALRAEIVPGVRIGPVRGDIDDPVVLDGDLDAARGQTVPAEGVHGGHGADDRRSPVPPGRNPVQAWVMAQYSPRRAINSSWLPRSTMRPSSRTRIRSASRTVDNRCAMMKLVRSRRNSVIACWISTSVRVSTELVASSRINSCGRARNARAM